MRSGKEYRPGKIIDTVNDSDVVVLMDPGQETVLYRYYTEIV